MPLPVQLQAVVDELEVGDDEWNAFINRKTGEVTSCSRELLRCVEDEEDTSKLLDWQLELLQECRRVLEDSDFIHLPSKFDIHEYSIMERFCLSLDDDDKSGRLLDAIRGRGAFRRFKDLIHRQGIEEDWYRYRNDALKQIAADFLEAHGIPYLDDKAGPGPAPEAG